MAVCACSRVCGHLCKYGSKCCGQEARLKYRRAHLMNQRFPRGFWLDAALWTINLDLRRNTFVSILTSQLSATCCIGLVLLLQPCVLFSLEFNSCYVCVSGLSVSERRDDNSLIGSTILIAFFL